MERGLNTGRSLNTLLQVTQNQNLIQMALFWGPVLNHNPAAAIAWYLQATGDIFTLVT